MTECLICGKVWKVSPDDPVPCLVVSEPRNGLDSMRGEHRVSVGAEKTVQCPNFAEKHGNDEKLPDGLEERVPGIQQAFADHRYALTAFIRAFSLAMTSGTRTCTNPVETLPHAEESRAI